jgi:hypothetical protein
MTLLNKPVKRRVDHLLRHGLTISILPTGLIGFKEYRSRTTYYLPMLTGYRMAVEADRLSKIAAKKKAKKEGKQNG